MASLIFYHVVVIFCSSFIEREDWFYTLSRTVTEHTRGSAFNSCSGEVCKLLCAHRSSCYLMNVFFCRHQSPQCDKAGFLMPLFQARDRLRLCLGEKAPTLVPVSQVMMCMNCTSDFSLTLRRHHCHGCGRVSQSKCC